MSFLKLKYLKTELNIDNGIYAIVYLTSHRLRIMINLSIICYFELMWHPLRTYLASFVFWQNFKTHPLLENQTHLIIHVFGNAQSPTLTGNLHNEYLNIGALKLWDLP